MSAELKHITLQLENINDILQKNDRIDHHIKRFQENYQQLETQMNALLDQLIKEERDVEKLKKMTFTNFFHTLKNDKPEQLTKEELEVMGVKSQIDHLTYELHTTRHQLQDLQREHENTERLRSTYKVLMEEKLKLIEAVLPEIWKGIVAKEVEIENIKYRIKEINEALICGEKAEYEINEIQKVLKSAENWGTYDMLGGGMIATLAKQGHIDSAQKKMHEFQHTLKTFGSELDDIGSSVSFDMDISGFLSVADWFFDGFFVDWAVQSKINNAQSQMLQIETRIHSILLRLREELSINENQIRTLKESNEEEVIMV